jgi:hypothetical protein
MERGNRLFQDEMCSGVLEKNQGDVPIEQGLL